MRQLRHSGYRFIRSVLGLFTGRSLLSGLGGKSYSGPWIWKSWSKMACSPLIQRETVGKKFPNEIALDTLVQELKRKLLPVLSIPRVWLNEEETATYLSLSTHLLRKWRCQGEGPIYYRVGNRILYKIQVLNEWVETHRIKRGVD